METLFWMMKHVCIVELLFILYLFVFKPEIKKQVNKTENLNITHPFNVEKREFVLDYFDPSFFMMLRKHICTIMR